MNTKNKLIEKLLKAAKKHKFLTYPVLALVAVISVFGNLFSWSKGAGKRVVAVVMVLVMLVSQSYFLTSSANTLVDTADSALVQAELQKESGAEDKADAESENIEREDESDDLVSENSAETADYNETADAANTADGQIAGGEEQAELNVADVDEIIDVSAPGEERNQDGERSVNVYFYYNVNNGIGEKYEPKLLYSQSISTKTGSSSVLDPETLSNALATAHAAIHPADVNNGCYSYDVNTWYDGDPEAAGSNASLIDKNNFDVGTKDMVSLYCKRTLEKYYLSVNFENVEAGWTSTHTLTNIPDTSKCEGLIPKNDNTITISNIYREGYILSGYKLNGADYYSNIVTVAQDPAAKKYPDIYSLTITVPEGSNNSLSFIWQNDKYSIKYLRSMGADGNDPSQYSIDNAVVYDGDSFFAGKDTADTKDGYEFAYWCKKGATPGEYKGIIKSSITANSESQKDWYRASKKGNPVVLYPAYTYNGIEANMDEMTFQYKDQKKFVFQAKYSSGGKVAKNVSYNLSNANGVDFANTFGIKVEPVTDSDGNEIGLAFDASALDSNGKACPKSTTGGVVPITITVTDNNDGAAASSGSGTNTQDFVVDFQVKKRTVTVKNPTNGDSKTYDGNVYLSTNFRINFRPIFPVYGPRLIKTAHQEILFHIIWTLM